MVLTHLIMIKHALPWTAGRMPLGATRHRLLRPLKFSNGAEHSTSPSAWAEKNEEQLDKALAQLAARVYDDEDDEEELDEGQEWVWWRSEATSVGMGSATADAPASSSAATSMATADDVAVKEPANSTRVAAPEAAEAAPQKRPRGRPRKVKEEEK